MALNDKFTIQEINLDKKDLSYDNNLKATISNNGKIHTKST